MTEVNVLAGEDDFEDLENKDVLLLDVEGTVTKEDKHVPQDPRPEHVYQMFEGENFEVKTDLGYWSGLHLLAGERPSEYFERVDKWWNGVISREEFEEKNVSQLNELLSQTDHETAEDLVEWYNRSFLDLRQDSYELVKIFQDQGFRVGMISHTSESLSVRAAQELGADFVVPSWRFRFSDGRFEFIEKKIYAEDKSEVVDEMEDAGVNRIAFIGNGGNDVRIAEEADRGYMVDNKEELDYSEIDARTDSFEKILEDVRQRFGGGS